MTRLRFALLLAIVGWFGADGARAQTANCPSGIYGIQPIFITTGGAISSTVTIRCIVFPAPIPGPPGPAGIAGPTGPQGPPGPTGSGTTMTGGPCTPPLAGVNLYAKFPDGSCLLVVAVPAPNFTANGVVNGRDVSPRFLDSPGKSFLVNMIALAARSAL